MKRIWAYIRRDRRRIWIALGLLTLLLRLLFSFSPQFVEYAYARGFYQAIRYLFDYTLGLIPLPFMEILLVGLMGWGVFRLIKSVRNRKRWGKWQQVLQNMGLACLAWIGGIIFFFHVLWGFNYLRMPIAQTLNLPVVQSDTTQLWETYDLAQRQMAKARNQIPGITDSALTNAFLPKDLESDVRNALKLVLQETGFPTPGRVRARKWWPEGIPRRLGPIGIYIPFTGEATVDGSLMAARMPATMAHEMAHAYGFADEGTCNFWAWLAMTRSKSAIFRYSGWSSLWRYVGGEVRKLNPQRYKDVQEALPLGIKKDLIAMRDNSRKYRGFGSRLGQGFNNVYLKAQGIPEGAANYNKMVQLAIAWLQSHGELASPVKSASQAPITGRQVYLPGNPE